MLVSRELLLAALTRCTRKMNARLHHEGAAQVQLSGLRELTLLTTLGGVTMRQTIPNRDDNPGSLHPVALPARRLLDALRGFEGPSVDIQIEVDRAVGQPVTVGFRAGQRRFNLAGRRELPHTPKEGWAPKGFVLPQGQLLRIFTSTHHALDWDHPVTLRGIQGTATVHARTRTHEAQDALLYLTPGEFSLTLLKGDVDILMDFLTTDPDGTAAWAPFEDAASGFVWVVTTPNGTLHIPHRGSSAPSAVILGELLMEAQVESQRLGDALQYAIRTHKTEQIDPYVSITLALPYQCTVAFQGDQLQAQEELPARVAKAGTFRVNANLLFRAARNAGFLPTFKVHTPGSAATTGLLLEITCGHYRTLIAVDS